MALKKQKVGSASDDIFEAITWLNIAIDTYYRNRLYNLLDQIKTIKPTNEILCEWNDIMFEMFGESDALKQDLLKEALKDTKISQVAKEWLKINFANE